MAIIHETKSRPNLQKKVDIETLVKLFYELLLGSLKRHSRFDNGDLIS